MELVVTRERIRRLLSGVGHPHLVLRISTADPAGGAVPNTPRRAR
ncbi:hypothetical protein AB0G04_33090 [Actinoplanes sp. NPDC023801]